MARHKDEDYEREFGKMLCDRLGYDPNRIAVGYNIETVSASRAVVRLATIDFMDRGDLMELRQAARDRVDAQREAEAAKAGAQLSMPQEGLLEALQRIGHPGAQEPEKDDIGNWAEGGKA
jgi:hypothetical protein